MPKILPSKKLKAAAKKQRRKCVWWKPINNKWFLDYENLKIRMGDQTFTTGKSNDTVKADKKA